MSSSTRFWILAHTLIVCSINDVIGDELWESAADISVSALLNYLEFVKAHAASVVFIVSSYPTGEYPHGS